MKKLLITFLAFVGLFLAAPVPQASAEVFATPFVAGDIKQDYCGPIMHYTFCKCAWHNQYCAQAGMDQAAAVNYVTSAYNGWVAKKKATQKEMCEEDIKSFWTGDGCTLCLPPHYNVGNSCKDVKDLCGDDEQVMWDYKKNACTCPIYYEWNAKEKKCEEIKLVDFDFQYLDSESVIADGKSKVGFSVSAELIETGEAIPLQIKILTKNKTAGTLDIIDDSPELYLMEYVAPDLLAEDPSTIKPDTIAITYTTALGERSQGFPIELFVGMPAKISKPGFESSEIYIQFKADTAKVKVMTATRNMQEFPLVDALVETKDGPNMRTDEEGIVTLDNPRPGTGSGEVTETKAFMVIDPEIDALRTKTMDQYIQTGITDPTVDDYIRNFEKHLAQSSGNENQKATVDSLKRIQYSLFYIKKGNEMGGVAAKNMAGAVKDAVWNVIDSIESIGDLGELLNVKLLTDYKSLNDQAKSGFKKSFDFMSDKLKNSKKAAWDYIANTFTTAITKYAPNFAKDNTFVKGLFDTLYNKIGNESVKAGYDELQLEGWIEDYFVKAQKAKSKQGMDMIASRIKQGNWVPLYGNDWLEGSKGNYEYLMKTFNDATQTEYTVSTIKAFSEVGIDTVNTAANFFPQFKGFAKGLDLYYKGVRTAFLDSETMYAWFETSANIADMTFAASAKALGMPKEEWTNPADRSLFYLPSRFISKAYAEEGAEPDEDLETVLAERDTLDETTRNNLVEYKESSAEAEFYSEWAEAAEFLIELYPEEKDEIKAFINEFEEKGEVAKAKKAELSEKIGDLAEEMDGTGAKGECDELDVNCDGKVDLKDITVGEWVALGVIVLILYFIIKGIRRVFKRKKK